MPLYMDIHSLPDDVTPEALEQAHVADVKLEKKYGVHFHGYWYDKTGRTVACLIEGKDAEACDAVHREAHGLVADKIIEVTPTAIQQFLGDGTIAPSGEARRDDGSFDTGMRVVLFTEVDNLSAIGARGGDTAAVTAMSEHDRVVRAALARHGGREISHTGEGIMATFSLASGAVQCGAEIQLEVAKRDGDRSLAPAIRIGMAAGEPVAQSETLYGIVVDQARAICRAAHPGDVLVSTAVRDLCAGKGLNFGVSASIRLPGVSTPLQLASVSPPGMPTAAMQSPPAVRVNTTAATTATLESALADRYTIERELGRGGMATVYLARDSRHDRHVAIKVLADDVLARGGSNRFLQEIRVAAKLTHPNIVSLFDSGEANGLPYYVMPHLEGSTLRDVITRDHQLPIDRAVDIARVVSGALGYAHRQGVVHRDVKPDNILLHDGQPMVLDFGIALALTQVGDERLTRPGLAMGTPAYMSPEQITGDSTLDARTDVYSIACVLFEMLVGTPPFSGAPAQSLMARIVTDRAPRAGEQRPGLPRHVDDAIDRALAKSPAERFGSASEFAVALAAR